MTYYGSGVRVLLAVFLLQLPILGALFATGTTRVFWIGWVIAIVLLIAMGYGFLSMAGFTRYSTLWGFPTSKSWPQQTTWLLTSTVMGVIGGITACQLYSNRGIAKP